MAEVEKEDYLGVFKKIHNRNIAIDPENQTQHLEKYLVHEPNFELTHSQS